MKRIIFHAAALILLCVTLCTLISCTGEKDVDVHDLCKKITASVTLPEMLEITETADNAKKGLSAITDLDIDKVEAFDLYYAADGSAYEIAVIRLKDESDAAALEQSLTAHIRKRTESFRFYKPEEAPRAESAVAAVNRRYAALLMCDDPAKAKSVFDAAFDGADTD